MNIILGVNTTSIKKVTFTLNFYVKNGKTFVRTVRQGFGADPFYAKIYAHFMDKIPGARAMLVNTSVNKISRATLARQSFAVRMLVENFISYLISIFEIFRDCPSTKYYFWPFSC